MTDIAELTAKLEADTRQFDQAMKGSNKHMEDAKKLVSEWSDEFKTASDDVDKYVKKLEGRIEDLEKQNETSTNKMGEATKRLKDNVDKNSKYIQERYGAIGKASEQAGKQVSDFSRVLKWSLYVATAGLAGTTSLALIKQQSFELNRELDETIRLMKQISGRSGEGIARDIFDMNTPFSRDVLTSSAYQMLASQEPAGQVSNKLQIYADTAYGLGGDDQTLEAISTSMALLGNRGTEFEGYSGLANLGINVDEYIKPLGDGSTLNALQKLESGAISTQQVVSQVLVGLNRDFANLIDTQEKTYTSAMNTIGKYIEETSRKFGESWYNKMRQAANNVASTIVDVLESDEWQKGIENTSKALESVFTNLARRAEEISRSMLPVFESLSNLTFTGIEVGAEVVKAADPAITSVSRTIEVFGKMLSWVTNIVSGLLDKFKGLKTIFAIMFSVRAIKGVAMMASHMKGFADLLGFTRKMGDNLSKNFANGFSLMRKGAKDLNNEFKSGVPKSLQGFARGFRSAFIGIGKGAASAIAGVQAGFYRATKNMNKTLGNFFRGMVGATREGTKAFTEATKATAMGLNLMKGNAVKSFGAASKAVGAFGKSAAQAFAAFGKGLAVIGKWIAGFFGPAAAVIAAFHLLADVMEKDNQRKMKAAEANRTYTNSLKEMSKEIESAAESFSLGTGPEVENLNRRDFVSRLLFANEEQEQEAYARYKNYFGTHAEDPFTLLAAGSKTRNQRIREELEAAGVYDENYRHLTGRNMEQQAAHLVAGGNTNYANGTRLWDQIAFRIGGLLTDERGGFNRMLGGDFNDLYDRIDGIITAFKLSQDQETNFQNNFQANMPELAELLEETPGFDRLDLTRQLGMKPKQDLYIDSTVESLIREHTEGMPAVDLAKFSADVFDYHIRAVKEDTEAVRSSTEAYKAADAAMLVNARGLRLASNSLLDLNKSAAIAASGLESVADQAARVLFENTRLFDISAAAHSAQSVRFGAQDAADLFINQGISLTHQAGNILDTIQQASVPLIEQALANAGRDGVHFSDIERGNLVGKVLTETTQALERQVVGAGVSQDEWNTFEQNFLRDSNVDISGKPVTYTQKEINAIGERAGSLWLSGLEDLTTATNINTGAVTSLTDSIQRYGEDGHLILKPGATWDLNFGQGTVLDTDSQFMDARVIQDDPFHVDSGGGGGGRRATEKLIPTHSRFQIEEPEPFDYSVIDGAKLLEENRRRNEIVERNRDRRRKLDTYATDREAWSWADSGSFENIKRNRQIINADTVILEGQIQSASMLDFYREGPERISYQTLNPSGKPIRVLLEVVDTEGRMVHTRIISTTELDSVAVDVERHAQYGRTQGPYYDHRNPAWSSEAAGFQ